MWMPLVKTKNMLDSEEYGSYVNAGPAEPLDIPGHGWREYRLSKRQVALGTQILWRIKLTSVSDRTVYFPAHNDTAELVPACDLPRGDSNVRLDSRKYQDGQVLAYEGCRARDLFQPECALYAQWLATPPPSVERPN
ncbi:hypothetical protein PC119_g10107 [Phytophthora cactorum]|nr:hypothetical protein PC119_g10107 [Phytophthora cactorum]